MVIGVLGIGGGRRDPAASAPRMLRKEVLLLAGDDRLQPHSPEVLSRPGGDPLKADVVEKARPPPDREVLAGHLKADPETLRPGVRHPRDGPLRETFQVREGAGLVVRHIGAIAVEPAHVPAGTIGINDPLRQAPSDKAPAHPDMRLILRIVLQELADPVAGVRSGRHAGCPLPFSICGNVVRVSPVGVPGSHEGKIDLQQKFHADQDPLSVALIDGGGHAAQLIEKGRQEPARIPAQLLHGKARIGPAAAVIVRQDILIESPVPVLQVRDRQDLKRAVLQHPPVVQKEPDPGGCRMEIRHTGGMDDLLRFHHPDPLPGESEAFPAQSI